MDPGPLDTSVLTLQDSHRSTAIWQEEDRGILKCRHHLGKLTEGWVLDDRVIMYVRRVGLYGVHRLKSTMSLDRPLITALVERWRQETHTFHLAVGEATITLKDVAVLLGLRVHGAAVTGTSVQNWAELLEELLGVKPGETDLVGSSVKHTWLRDHFAQLPADADDVTIERHARAYVLILIGGVLFADKTGNEIQLIYLQLLRDWDIASQYSWGSAALAFLYRQLCRASNVNAKEIAGPLLLLQLWSWDHIAIGRPIIAPHEGPLLEGGDPYGCRWLRVELKRPDYSGTLSVYRELLDHQSSDEMIWDPYGPELLETLPEMCRSHQHIWRTRSPLICFDIVEWHFPERVFRQFGMTQRIPPACDTVVALHKLDRRGKPAVNWASHHRKFISLWVGREGAHEGQRSIQEAEPAGEPMSLGDPYMVWYRRITRRYISRSSVRPSSNVLIDHCASIYMGIQKLLSGPHDVHAEVRMSLETMMQDTARALEQAGHQLMINAVAINSNHLSLVSSYALALPHPLEECSPPHEPDTRVLVACDVEQNNKADKKRKLK